MSDNDVVLRPRRGIGFPSLREVWDRRDLLLTFVERDVRVRYRQTFFGAAWAVIPALFTMAVFTFVFGNFLGVPSGSAPYWAFSLSALVPWGFFSQAVVSAANSVTNSASLIEKVYFPRVLLPSSAVFAHLVDLGVSLTIMLVLLVLGGVSIGPLVAAILTLTLIAVVAALGAGMALAAVNVIYRDVRHVVPLLLQLWLFVTPVVYPLSAVPEALRLAISLNPIVSVVEGYHWALLGEPIGSPLAFAISIASAVLMLVLGATVFGTLDRRFADTI